MIMDIQLEISRTVYFTHLVIAFQGSPKNSLSKTTANVPDMSAMGG